jgi:hypothetical protein
MLEASRELGGRARRLAELELGGERHMLDNGQRGDRRYTEVAAPLRLIGVSLDSVSSGRPFELRYADGFQLQAARLPAPWHLAWALLTSRGLDFRERAAMVGQLRTLAPPVEARCRQRTREAVEAAGQGPHRSGASGALRSP